MFQNTLARRMSGLAGAAMVAGLGVPCLAQFEKSWDDAVVGNFEFRAIERVTSGLVPGAEYVIAGGTATVGAAGGAELAYWDTNGNPVPGTRRVYTRSGTGAKVNIFSVRELVGGDILAVGNSSVPGGGLLYDLVMRLDANLQVIWAIGGSFHAGQRDMEAMELSDGRIMVVDVVWIQDGPYVGPQTRVAFYTSAGAHISSRSLRTVGGSRIILRDIVRQDDERVYGAGTIVDQAGVETACVLRLDPTLAYGSQVTGLWSFGDLDAVASHFYAIEMVRNASEIMVAGTVIGPGATAPVETRVTRIRNLGSMTPQLGDDVRYNVDLVPAGDGLRGTGTTFCGLGVSLDHAYLAGASMGGQMASMMLLDAFGTPTAYGIGDFGAGPPLRTAFRGLTLTGGPEQLPVMVGSRLNNLLASGEDHGYLVKTGCNWGTYCSTTRFPATKNVRALYAAVAPMMGPVIMVTGMFGLVEQHVTPALITSAPVFQGFNVTVCGVCKWDLTTGAVPGQPGYGVPNGVLNNDDFFFYLAQFSAGNLAIADMTTGAIAGQPGYGVPNGVLNNDDFFYYLAGFSGGC